MINETCIDPSAINAGAHNGNRSQDHYYYEGSTFIYILSDFTLLISIFGILGNGTVIWLLGFQIKRSPFTIFILNLAVADFGVLIATIMDRMNYFSDYLQLLPLFSSYTFFCMFSTSQMFLTVISVDRCVSVFFPFWHRCHRPTWLSPLVCALAWLLSSLATITELILYRTQTDDSYDIVMYLLIANGFLCIPLMTISSLMLFLKVCCKSRQQRRQKLLTTILVTVSFFLFFCFPFNTFMFVVYFKQRGYFFWEGAVSFACLNSIVNPLIYYLVGRRNEGRCNRSMKVALQNLFIQEEI